MPHRSFRVMIQNASSSLTLNQTFSHLCHGEWTGGWAPPPSIAPGALGGMQSESDGFMTGTEGYVKYDVVGPTGLDSPPTARQGMIYIYWDNPFYGYTHFRFATSSTDVPPDCDFSIPAGTSAFPGGGDLDFALNFTMYQHGVHGGGDITSLSDFVNYVVGPVSLLGLVGIDDNPELDLELDDAASAPPESFGTASLGPVNLQLLNQATMQQWVGDWENGNVNVNISQSGRELTATIYDGTSAPPLSFTDTFVPGAGSLLGPGVGVVQNLVNAQSEDPAQRSAFSKAAKTVIGQVAKSPSQAAAAAKHFQSLVENLKTSTPLAVVQAKTRTVSTAIAELLQAQGGVAYLSNHVALRLFGTFQRGKQTGEQLQYQRLDLVGRPVTSLMLGLGEHIT